MRFHSHPVVVKATAGEQGPTGSCSEKRERALPLPPARSWVVDPTFRLLARCDRCRRRRLFAPYFEVYGTVDENHGEGVWWWECYLCLIDTLTTLAEERRLLGGCPHSGG